MAKATPLVEDTDYHEVTIWEVNGGFQAKCNPGEGGKCRWVSKIYRASDIKGIRDRDERESRAYDLCKNEAFPHAHWIN